jgi:hypothetical protein
LRRSNPIFVPHTGLLRFARNDAVGPGFNSQAADTRLHSRGAVRPRFALTSSLREEGAGKAGRPEHPQPVCIGSKHTVVTTSTPEDTRLSPRNGFNGFLRALPGDEFLFVTVVSRIDSAAEPVGSDITSADLTSATDARTTRLRRTQRPQPSLDKPCAACRSLTEALKRRSSCALSTAHEDQLALRSFSRPTLPRPPQPIPHQ